MAVDHFALIDRVLQQDDCTASRSRHGFRTLMGRQMVSNRVAIAKLIVDIREKAVLQQGEK